MQSSILQWIWLNFMVLFLVFIGSFTVFTFFWISTFFDLSITDETWLVEMHIWCIKIGIVLVLHVSITLDPSCRFENIYEYDRYCRCYAFYIFYMPSESLSLSLSLSETFSLQPGQSADVLKSRKKIQGAISYYNQYDSWSPVHCTCKYIPRCSQVSFSIFFFLIWGTGPRPYFNFNSKIIEL
jgi:hypothetical protein